MNGKIRTILRFLANPDIMFFTLIWLMVILVAGTVAQKYIGLFEAQRMFFSSFVLWWGFMPLPGGAAALTLVFTALSAKLLCASRWNIKSSGTVVTHIGALLLLFGGFLTGIAAVEGSMVIAEGETVNFITDGQARELAIEDASTGASVLAVPWERLAPGLRIPVPDAGALALEIVQTCRNCAGIRRAPHDQAGGKFKGWATNHELRAIPPAQQAEDNKSGTTFTISGSNADGIYSAVDILAPVLAEADGRRYDISIRKRRIALPFAIMLERFDRQTHPGTDIPSLYRSDIILKDGAAEWKSVIRMNAPLRYQGYSIYQSSFIESEGQKPATVLAVVKNAGRMFPYISGLVTGVGLLLVMVMRLPAIARRRAATALLAALVAMPMQAQAGDFDMSDFKRIPVQAEGRVMPIAGFARRHLTLFYGAPALPDMTADAWLAELLMMPARAYDRAVFALPDPRIVDVLGLPQRRPRLYSFREVGAGLAQHEKAWRGLSALPEEQLTASQNMLLAAIVKIRMFGDLSRSLSLLFPDFVIPGQTAAMLSVPPGTPMTYAALRPYQDRLEAMGRQAAKRQQERAASRITDSLAADDAALLDLLQRMETVARDGDSVMFRVVPPQTESAGEGKLWLPPWSLSMGGTPVAPDRAAFLALWQDLIAAYRAGDAAQWAQRADSIQSESLRMAGNNASSFRLDLETLDAGWEPMNIAMLGYGFGLLLMLAALTQTGRRLDRAAVPVLLLALGWHGAGLAARMIIMERPPVTNLYASIIFVAFLLAAAGLVYERRARNRIGAVITGLGGGLLLLIARRYDHEGDTMGLLTAALDTNFWLSTHVVCMTAGYAACLLGALMAHIDLILRIARPRARALHDSLGSTMRGVSYLALFFSLLGTVLGGIWADQSWGRFWGWDPKENGALLIVLWLLFLTHGRAGGRLGALGFSAGMALTGVIVSLAWFGVNLLNIGLHSYGFTEGGALWLSVYGGGEILFVAASIVMVRRWRGAVSSV